jgi:hypothetical protein
VDARVRLVLVETHAAPQAKTPMLTRCWIELGGGGHWPHACGVTAIDWFDAISLSARGRWNRWDTRGAADRERHRTRQRGHSRALRIHAPQHAPAELGGVWYLRTGAAALTTDRSGTGSGDIREHSPKRGASAFADRCLDPSAQRLRCADLVKQPSSRAVVGLPSHREKHVLGADDEVTPCDRELFGLAQ